MPPTWGTGDFTGGCPLLLLGGCLQSVGGGCLLNPKYDRPKKDPPKIKAPTDFQQKPDPLLGITGKNPLKNQKWVIFDVYFKFLPILHVAKWHFCGHFRSRPKFDFLGLFLDPPTTKLYRANFPGKIQKVDPLKITRRGLFSTRRSTRERFSFTRSLK